MHSFMAVIAVGGDDVVIFAEEGNRADGHRFLANVEVQETCDIAAMVLLQGDLLKPADACHFPVQLDLVFRGELLVDGGFRGFGGGRGFRHGKRGDSSQIGAGGKRGLKGLLFHMEQAAKVC
jgi:hypothetical protein